MSAIGISANDKYIAVTDAAEKVMAYVYDMKKGTKVAEVPFQNKATHLDWHPTDEDMFAICGEK